MQTINTPNPPLHLIHSVCNNCTTTHSLCRPSSGRWSARESGIAPAVAVVPVGFPFEIDRLVAVVPAAVVPGPVGVIPF